MRRIQIPRLDATAASHGLDRASPSILEMPPAAEQTGREISQSCGADEVTGVRMGEAETEFGAQRKAESGAHKEGSAVRAIVEHLLRRGVDALPKSNGRSCYIRLRSSAPRCTLALQCV